MMKISDSCPCVLALLFPLALVAGPLRSADGVWSVPVGRSLIADYTPVGGGSVPEELGVWSNGAVTLASVGDENAASGRVFQVNGEGNLVAFIVRHTCDLENGILTFEYRLPPGANVISLGASVRVKEWNGELVGIRLVPTFGEWKTERFPLSRLMQGDEWRLSGAKTASQLEVGVVSGGKGIRIDFANIRLESRPTSFSPMIRPSWLSGGMRHVRRFTVSGTPQKAWAMAYGTTNFTLAVNGRVVGRGPKSSAEDWRGHGKLTPAADQWSLDGAVREGGNEVALSFGDRSSGRGLVVCGWESEGRRHVVVSDGDWETEFGRSQAESLPEGKRPILLDIYPLRGADAWCSSAKRPDYGTLPSYSPTADRLQVRPMDGKWGTVRGTDGRWYFVAPDGRPFFFYAMQTVNAFWPNYGYANWARRAYADEREWAEDAVVLVRRLGFNGLGVAATAQSAFRAAAAHGMVNLENIGCGDGGPALVNAKGERQWGLADPFDEEFSGVLRRRLAECAVRWNARPDVFAICVGNEACIEGNILNRPSSGYVYSKACGREFIRWLGARHGNDIRALNAAWFGPVTNRYFATFDEILVRRPDPFGDVPKLDDPEYAAALAHGGKSAAIPMGRDGGMRRDFDAFAVHVVGAYAELVLRLMRERFPDKLIVSNRFMGGATREMYACWRGYDAIAVNTYPLDTWGDAVYNERKVRLLRDAYEATGRPVLLTEWGVQGMDVNLQSPAAQLRTQRERGQGYEKVLRQVVETMPFVAGAVTFGFQHLADSEGQGWGIVDNQGRPYRDYLEGMVSAARWLDDYLRAR